MIVIDQANKVFTTSSGEVHAVDDVSLHIQKGEIFGVIGYSGAGKSTLIRMLNGLELPTSGSITVAGRDVSKIKGKALREARQAIGMIFQHFNLLWSRTVKENIAFPLEISGTPKKDREKKVQELIQLVGLEGREHAYPSQLSGGQKQRVGIARALANDPEVLLCDEATSALDPETTDAILDLLVDINKKLGLTIVLITHEMHVIRKICQRVAVMEDGRVVEEGVVRDVFSNPHATITKRFVQQLTESKQDHLPTETLLKRYKEGKVLKFTFRGGEDEQTIIPSLIKDFNLKVKMIKGNITEDENGTMIGVLLIHIDGRQEEIERVLNHLDEKQMMYEVVTNND